MFSLDKKNALTKLDKSKSGEIDKDILELVNKINSHQNFYTTSSCSGRIVITKELRKGQYEWLLKSHEPITFEQIKPIINNLPKEDIWFKQESMILHIACKTLEDTNFILNKIKPDFKRAGIISTKNKFLIEIYTTDNMATIIAKVGLLLVDENYLNILIAESNQKLKNTKNKIKKLMDLIGQDLEHPVEL